MCGIYSLRASPKFKGLYFATYWAAHIRCILGILFIVPIQRQCHGESK